MSYFPLLETPIFSRLAINHTIGKNNCFCYQTLRINIYPGFIYQALCFFCFNFPKHNNPIRKILLFNLHFEMRKLQALEKEKETYLVNGLVGIRT